MRSDFGLIGKKLTHSFSKHFFEKKFEELGLTNHHYHLFELDSVHVLKTILSDYPDLKGINVTIPYKEEVMGLLHEIDPNAKKIGSVNVIRVGSDGKLKGYNTDYYGFMGSIDSWLPTENKSGMSALVLGTGGASKAVNQVLSDMSISSIKVSRNVKQGAITYQQLREKHDYLDQSLLIVNTTPLGMSPNIQYCPDINYSRITKEHFVYDLVYNPEETLFLARCKEMGAHIKNGLEMLHLQAEKSWEIWHR